MPTNRPRYQVPATPTVDRALDAAARRWPGESRSRLLVRLVEVGARSVDVDVEAGLETHRHRVAAVAAKYDGLYGDGYLTDLRADWPAE